LAIPSFAHMPLMMGSDGAKLSKRHGAVSVAEYRKEGYLPEGLANYLLLLGWSPGGEKEIIRPEEAVKIFDIKDIGDVQARFDVDKLQWINGEYIRKKTPEALFDLLKDAFAEAGFIKTDTDSRLAVRIIALYKERARVLKDFSGFADCFFHDDFEIDQKGFEKYIKGNENQAILDAFCKSLNVLETWTRETTEKTCRELADKMKIKPAGVIHPTRMAISGSTKGAGLFDIMELLGKRKCIERIGRVLESKSFN